MDRRAQAACDRGSFATIATLQIPRDKAAGAAVALIGTLQEADVGDSSKIQSGQEADTLQR
jgi:hypothetical protein